MPPLAPRPFLQLARRCWRLGLDVPLGYIPGLSGAPWYRRRRRRPVVSVDTPRARYLSRRRFERLYWRRRGRIPVLLVPAHRRREVA